MTEREKEEYKIHVQKRMKVALGFAPSRTQIVLLEAGKCKDLIDYVLFRVGTAHYRCCTGSLLEMVDEDGHHIAFLPSRFEYKTALEPVNG